MINIRRLNIIGLVLLISGLVFIGSGITGKAVYGTSSDYCSLNVECASEEICCIVSGAIGMCQAPEICGVLKSNGVETPIDYSSYTGIGANLVIFAIIIFIIAYLGYKKERIKVRKRFRGKR